MVRPSERSEGGFRLYSDDDIARLELIKDMKPLGFTIQEIHALLAAQDALRAGPDPDALDALNGFVTAASQRVDELRVQHERAEGFLRILQREAKRYKRAARAAA